MGLLSVPADRMVGGRHFDSIQGLRAWAMVLVFSYHLHHFIQDRWPNGISEAVLTCGGLGTNLFLCISGCFLYRSLQERPVAYRDFLARRFWRLYPVYAFMLAVYLLVELVLQTGRLGLRYDASDLMLMARNLLLLPVFLGEQPMMEVSWTLAYIAAFSVLAPGLARLMNGWRKPARLGLLWALWMASWWLCAQTSLVPQRATLLLGGVLAWELMPLRLSWASVAFLAMPGLILGQPAKIALMPGVLLVVLKGVPLLDDVLRNRVFQVLGSRGYSFYLTHGLALLAAQAYLFPRLNLQIVLMLQPVLLLCSLGVAEAVYRFVELPCRYGRPRPVAEAAPQPAPMRAMAAGA